MNDRKQSARQEVKTERVRRWGGTPAPEVGSLVEQFLTDFGNEYRRKIDEGIKEPESD